MKKKLVIFLFLITVTNIFPQTGDRTLLRGKVMYKNTNVVNENVINITSEKATITNDEGEFEIYVKPGDELAFSAINYKLKTVKITEEIVQNNRLVVEVNEKITELDEVIVTSENEEKFMELKQEEFKKIDYDRDASTPVENYALSQSERGMKNGLNLINIFKALFKSNKKKEVPFKNKIKVSQVLRQVYEDEFFVVDLKIPRDKINDFLYYCDEKISAQSLLRKENEFQLIDFLVSQSKAYRKKLD